ncbi:MAG: DUF3048 C-terminal domain-containing protein [Actinomycetota bacterium]|nr:DUF3048 C-terminal domain-containing protein [Actinomycetota bacterium]
MSVAKLREKASQLGYPLEGNGIPFPYKSEAPLSAIGNTSNIHISFSTHAYSPAGFNVDYKYDKSGNYYLRYMGGYPHIDYNSGNQITAKNIVVMTTDILGPLDKYGHMDVRTTGSGTAYIFLDGRVIHGSWQRGSVYEPFVFKDSSGRRVSLNSGSTWISIVQGADKVSFN